MNELSTAWTVNFDFLCICEACSFFSMLRYHQFLWFVLQLWHSLLHCFVRGIHSNKILRSNNMFYVPKMNIKLQDWSCIPSLDKVTVNQIATSFLNEYVYMRKCRLTSALLPRFQACLRKKSAAAWGLDSSHTEALCLHKYFQLGTVLLTQLSDFRVDNLEYRRFGEVKKGKRNPQNQC